MSAPSSFVGEASTDDSNGVRPEWLQHYSQRKSAVVEDANAVQSELDPSQNFSALPPVQKARLTKALLRFFLMKQGVAPSVPISREDVVRVFETARREANLGSTQKLLPYFMAEVQKTLAEIFGLEIRDVIKRIPSEEAKKKKKDTKPVRMLYLQSLLPTSIRSQFMGKGEKEMLGVIGVLVRLVCASEGKLKKAEAIQLLRNLELREGEYHPIFGQWEHTIFDEAVKRRFLIVSKATPDVYELGEASFLEVSEDDFPNKFFQCTR